MQARKRTGCQNNGRDDDTGKEEDWETKQRWYHTVKGDMRRLGLSEDDTHDQSG